MSIFSPNPNNDNTVFGLVENSALQAYNYNLFGQQQPANFSSALSSLTSNANQLSTAIQSLVATDNTNVFQQTTASSTNSSVATALSQPGATVTSYNLTVNSLAQAQVNQGTVLNSTATTSATVGTDIFNLSVNGQVTPLSVTVGSSDTNGTFLSNMAQAINNANAGVTASVITNSANNTSQLQIIANSTGTTASFGLSDVSGNAVSSTGANTMTTSEANASYVLNNQAQTSGSNTLNEDNGNLQISLLSASANPVTINVTNNTQAIGNDINYFVNSYNTMVSFLQQNSLYISGDVLNSLTQGVNDQLTNLQNIGITLNPDQTLSVNQSMLNNALSTNLNQVQDTFSSWNGVGNNVNTVVQNILTTPSSNFMETSFNSSGSNSNYGLYNFLGRMEYSSAISGLFPSGNLLNALV